MTPTHVTWREVFVELFDADMCTRWGWRAPYSLNGRSERPVAADARLTIDVDGLAIPYFNGRVTIDFGAREIVCEAFDQKTPADHAWQLEPDAAWWTRALACDWPQR